MDPQQILDRLKALVSSLSAAQLASLVGAFVLVVGIFAGSALWLNKPTYALLFSDMDAETAGEIVTKLKNLKVQYQLDEGGRGIRVPANRVDELRLELTSQGLPQSGRVGFEIFDRTAFGATEFLEQVNYRRALEGEIARTISTLSEVASARVHIAMGKDTLFGEPRPAKASVVLKLKGQRTLATSTIAGISNLVASSVDGLRPESVVILDSFGRPLARPDGDNSDPMGGAQLERQQRIEREMSTRVIALLEPIIGADRVRVNVALKLNPQSREETQERWDPNAVIRSRQTQSDSSTQPTSGGLAGARGNAVAPPPDPKNPNPPAVQTQALASAAGSQRNAETTNFEVSRTTTHTIQPPGDIARLSVAVILDDDQEIKKSADGKQQVTRKPRSREELQKIHGLVAAAVGLEADRGDQLTVENVSFEETPIEDVPPPTLLEKYSPHAWEGARLLVIALLGLFGMIFFVRPLMRNVAAANAVKAVQKQVTAAVTSPDAPIKTVADLESEIEAQLDAAVSPNAESRRLPVLARRVSTITTKEPENVAKLIRGWMNEQER